MHVFIVFSIHMVFNNEKLISLFPRLCCSFTMKAGRAVCVDATQQWVKNIIKTKELNQTKKVTNSTTMPSQ